MAPLFSKVDSNKLWLDVQHEENVICAKFGKDLFNVSKVIGRKKVAQFFWLTMYIVAKRFVLEQKLLLRAYRKSYMRNRLVPKWMTLTFV